MPCGWEGNRGSGVALAMRHRLQWRIHLLAHGLDREMSTPPTLLVGCGALYVLLSQRTHTHTRLAALCPGLPRWVSTRKVKPIWILLKQETVSSSGISWAVCKSAPRSRQITTPAPHHSGFYRPDALPATQPTASKH